jgi:hypothetical protein
MIQERITPKFQLITHKGKAMQSALLSGLSALEHPQGELCSPQVTDNIMGIVVYIERRKLVTPDQRWSVRVDVDPYDSKIYKYRTVFPFESANEAEIIQTVRTLLTASQ